MNQEQSVRPEIYAALNTVEPGIMLVQIGRYGMSHPPATYPFEYTHAILKSLLFDETEIEAYIYAAQEMGATDDKTLVLNVLQPLSNALREATHSTLNAIAARK